LQRALLLALVAPITRIRAAERGGDTTTRLALLEEAKSLPFAAVWDYYCEREDVPVGEKWLAEVKRHERDVLSRRT
jgi:L-rhamnose isomerase